MARKDPTYKRNSSSLYLEDINMIVDTPEDITESINRENIETIDYVVFTHRHPDHTFGMRNVFNSFFDPIAQKPTKIVTILCPERVYEDIKQHFPSIDFFINVQKTAQIQFLNHNESIEINNMKITAL